MADFHDFKQFAIYLTKGQEKLAKGTRLLLADIWKLVKLAIQSKHGVQQDGRPSLQSGSNQTPLVKTWNLKDSVFYEVWTYSVKIGTDMEWLGLIHEFGVTYKMTEKQRRYLFANVLNNAGKGERTRRGQAGYITIPPRPIRRNILVETTPEIEKLVDLFLAGIYV